nr:iron and copper transporter IacT-like [Nerophis lumbriciformis]
MFTNKKYRSHSLILRGAVAVAVTACLATGGVYAQELEEIIVTAQKREVSLQTAPVAVTAFSGESLKRNRVFSISDLASSAPSLSLTQGSSPVDLELNIRGISNTRLDSPSGEAAVGTFLDDVYIGRNGGMNTDYYDIERIEVIRGPQGVLLGKSVVGGALSIITAKPEFENSGAVTIAMGNYDSQLLSGHVTGGLNENWAGRLSVQSRKHDGYGYDILHDREVDNWDSKQVRAQLLYQPDESKWNARLIVDYNKDHMDGLNSVAISDGLTGGFRPRPWSRLREFLGITDPRVSIPEETLYAGDSTPLNQFLSRESAGLSFNLEGDFESFTLNAITGYRTGRADNLYDQTGGGPDVLDENETFGVTFADFLAFDPLAATFFFSEPVREDADISAFSQELRLTSTTDGSMDWIAGVFYKRDEIDKFDRFVGEGNSGALPTLSGESHWINNGENTNIGVFGQIGWQFTDSVKLNVGARWTSDKKEGNMQGIAVATGDRFNPDDAVPLTPLQESYTTAYGNTWKKTTPQATLEWTPNDDTFTYLTVSTGFKGGYFQDTAPNAFAASFATRPEEVINYEIGLKKDFAGGRARINAAAFFMDYTDLQVEQTNQDCLCNLTENASDAEISGIEAEFAFAATDNLLINLSATFLDTEYVEFREASGVISSGNPLQRTPEMQYGANFDLNITSALNLFVNYAWQDKMPWQPANLNFEDSYGLLDARLTYAPEEAKWAASIWGKNITDELYRSNIIPFFGEEVSQFGPPGTYGVEFSYTFD